MLDVATAYPLLRQRRRRHWRPQQHHLRIATILVICAALVLGAVALLMREQPADARAELVAGLRALQAGDYGAARRHAEAAAAANPRDPKAYAVLARAHLERDDGVAAEGALTRAVAAGLPADRVHQLLAHARLSQGDIKGALASAGKARPPYADYAGRIRARALAADGRTVEARRALEARVAAASDDGRAWSDLGRLRLTVGDVGNASIAAGRAARLRPWDPHALTLAGEVVRARYGLIASLPWFEAALKRDADHHPALILYAATLGEAGRHAEMLAVLRRAMLARPGSGQAVYLQAVTAARVGNLDLASALLERAGGGAGAALLGGAIDHAAGRHEKAAARWRGLVEAQSMNIVARRLLAAAMLRSGDAREALTVLRPLAVRGDADAYALTLTARAFEAIGDRASAARFLDRASGARGRASVFASDTGLAALATGAAQSPTDPTYALGVIRGLVGNGDLVAATAKARALTLASPGAPAAQTAFGDVLAIAGRASIATYARAADLRFDEPTMLRLVDAQARAGRQRDAAATLALYLSQNPQSLIGQRMLGQLQLAAGEWAAAVETLEGVRGRVGNDEAGLLGQLALAYAGDDEGEVAVRYARAAYALQPMSADVCQVYGAALKTAGRSAEAQQLFDKARALASGDR